VANVVKHKRSSTSGETPSASDLDVGEIAVNTADGKLFVKHTDGTVVEISGGGGGGSVSTLSDTTITSLGDGELLVYDTTSSKWINQTLSEAGIAALTSPGLTGTPTAPTASAATNSTQIATTAYVTTAVSNLVDSAPGALNTLNELAAALGDDANFSTTVTNSIATKLPLSGGTMSGQLVIADNDGGQSMLQVRNFATSATGGFTNSYTAEIRGATSGGQTHGMLINLNEANDSRRTLDIGDNNGVFASFVNGKLGLGGQTSPEAKLDIKGDTQTYAGMAKIYLTDTSSSVARRNWAIGNGGSAYGNFTIGLSNAADGDPMASGTHTTPFIINNSGNSFFSGDVQVAGLYVGSSNTSYDFYNNGTTYLNGATTIDDSLLSGDIHIKSGTSGTNTQGLLFSLNDNADAQAYIKKTSYYMHYNAHQNEGHRFTVSGGDDLLRMHGANNGTRPDSIDILAANGLYMGNTQVMTLGRALTNITGGTVAGSLTVNSVTFKSNSNVTRNLKIQPSGTATDVGVSIYTPSGSHSIQLYGNATEYGFLDANWASWDIKKTKNGAFKVDEGGGLQRVFNDGYHPNADAWTTARTLSLSGDASGSVSWDGSANATLSVSVGDADTVDGKQATDLLHYRGAVSGDWDTIFTTGTGKTNTSGLYQINNHQSGHSNYPSGSYSYGGVFAWQLANSTFKLYAPHTGTLFYQTGWGNDEYSGWRKIWDSGNDGSGSGLDADLLDGVHGSSFLRSDADDTFTGDLTHVGGAVFGAGTLTADGQNDIFMFGTSPTGITAQGGNYHNKLRILGGAGQSRDLQLYQIDSEYAHIGSSWTSNQLTIDSSFTQVNFNQSIRAPIFYDSNDTAYYVDPASTSVVNQVIATNIEFGDSTGPILSEERNQNLKLQGSTGGDVGISGYGSDGNWDFQLYGTGGQQGFLKSNWGSWSAYADTSGNWFGTASVRAPIFYDSDNTGYYVDPASTGSSVRIKGNIDTRTQNSTTQNNQLYFGINNGNANGTSNEIGTGITWAPLYTSYTKRSAGILQIGEGNYFRSGLAFYTNNTADVSTDWSERMRLDMDGNLIINQAEITYTSGDNIRLTGSYTSNRLHINGSIQLTNNGDALVIGRGTSTFLSDEELGFGWGSGWYQTDATYLRVRNNKSVYSTGDARFSTYYDSNDTAYYANPNSDSRMARLLVGDGSNYIRIGDEGEGANTSYSRIRTDSSGNLYLDAKGSQNIYLGWWSSPASRVFSEMGAQFPVYYDRNDTAYYTNPANNSVMNQISLGVPGNGSNTKGRFIALEGNTDSNGEASSRIFFSEHNSSTASMDGYGMSLGYLGGATSITGTSGNAWTGLSQISNGQWGMWGHDGNATGALVMYGDRAATYVNFSGNDISGINIGTAGNSFRAPIFYDSNDTAYYVNPNGTSRLNAIDFGDSSPTLSQDGDYLRVTSSYGYANIGAGNSSYFHFSTDRGQFYFNKTIQVDGDGIRMYDTAADVRAYIFYDQSDTNYYADPASTSVFNQINVTTLNSTSDIRFKSDLQKIDSAVDKLKTISGYTYILKDHDDRKAGLIAQEVEGVLPEAVKGSEDKKLLDYQATIALLVEAVKEQSEQIATLKSRLTKLEH